MTAPATKAIPRSAEHITYVRYCESSRTPIHLCYQCFGDPTVQKEALVLIGGLNMQMTAFDETFCELLVESGFFVIRVDNRDCGFSTKVDGSSNNIILPGVSEKKSGEEDEEYGGAISNNMNKEFKVVGPGLLFPRNVASFFFGERLPYTIESMAKDILYLMIQQLKINTFHVLGISMGGMIAQTLLLLAPRHVRSLTSLMSTTNAPDLPDAQMWVKLWMLRKPPKYVPNPAIPNDKGVSDTIYHQNEALNHLLNFRVQSQQKLLTQTIPVDQNYLKNRYLLSLRRSPYGDGLLRQAAAIRRCPSRDGLFQKYNHTVISHVPVLVIHGAQDLVVPPAHGYRTAEMIAHSRLLIFKSMGHYFHPIFFYPIAMAMKEMATVVLTTQHALLQENESHSNFSWLNPSAPPSIAKLIADSNHHRLTKEEEEDNKGTFPSSAVSETPPSQYSSLYEAGRLYLPVVVSPGSPTGKAACAAVNVAVPLTIHKSEQHKSPDKKAKLESTPSSPTTSATTGNPSTMLPEAVLVDLNDSTAISVLHKWGVDPVARNMNPPPTNNNNSQNNSEEDLIYPLLPGMPSVWDTISLQNSNHNNTNEDATLTLKGIPAEQILGKQVEYFTFLKFYRNDNLYEDNLYFQRHYTEDNNTDNATPLAESINDFNLSSETVSTMTVPLLFNHKEDDALMHSALPSPREASSHDFGASLTEETGIPHNNSSSIFIGNNKNEKGRCKTYIDYVKFMSRRVTVPIKIKKKARKEK